VGARRRPQAARANRGEGRGSLGLAVQARDKLVFSKLKPAIGLGNGRGLRVGAAPIAKEVLEFFAGLDLIVLEVYGQSEDTGPTSFNRPGRTRFGTVGPICPGVEVKIAEDGEILVKGPNVFLGYYKEPEATAETLKDGWLCSGDLGASTPTGSSRSPAARRRSSSPRAARTSPRRTSRRPQEPARSSPRRGDRRPSQVPLGSCHARLTPSLKVKRRIVAKNFATEIEAMYARAREDGWNP
jgi:long-subunit acyl-CoA synthetase (AMP-forming)